MIKLIFLFIVIPLIELALLIHIGQHIGVMLTVIIIAATGIIGVSLARWQGLTIIKELQAAMQSGIIPGNQILDGLLILGAALVLLTPGFLTDIFGFLLLFPLSRRSFREFIKKILRTYLTTGRIYIYNK